MAKLKALLLSCMLLFTSCTTFQNYFKEIPKYDQKSYETFTYLKADVVMFYDNNLKNEDSYKDFIIRFNRIYEYEYGKKGNEEVAKQVVIIRDMFIRHYAGFPYSSIMLNNKKDMIKQAFDILISTEYMKKK